MTVSQTDFVKALLDPTLASPDGLQDPKGQRAGKRFDVYRNTVFSSLISAMETGFPVTSKLLGENIFKTTASQYIRIHPPTSAVLMLYGDMFPDFLKANQDNEIPCYIADIAQLELARRQSYHASDTNAISPKHIADIAPEDLIHQRFTLSPALRLIPSNHPIVSIWEAENADSVITPNNHGETALVTRPEFDVFVHIIDPATHAFISTLANETLGVAFDTALETDDQFDLTAALKLLLDQHLIIEIIQST